MAFPDSILVLAGPTASGKTEVGILCAEALGAEIINADSRQVYLGMDIGTAKPSPDQRRRVPHHLLDLIHPRERYSAGSFVRDAHRAIEDIHERGKQVLVVGGAGLYLRALTQGLFEGETTPGLREQIEAELRVRGAAALIEEIRHWDPEGADSLPVTNLPRIVRALEICRSTGQAFSTVRKERMAPVPFRSFLAGLRWDTAALSQRIERRVDAMLRAGFEDEVRHLLAEQGDEHWHGLGTLGYQELASYFTGRMSRSAARERIIVSTRAFARRQRTWFRRQPVEWYDRTSDDDVHAVAEAIIERYRMEFPESS